MSIAAYQGVCPTCRHDHSEPVTALASGSGDHAELARLASFAMEPPAASVIEISPATVLALLAEIAALKYAVQNGNEHLEFWEARATEAERKLAEAVGLLSELEQHVRAASDGRGHARAGVKSADAARAFLSKEAERG